MTDEQKLNRLKILLGITDTESDALLTEYLSMSGSEIIAWVYQNTQVPENAVVPPMYEQTQIMACVTGFNLTGGEGETSHIENGIHRYFKYADMIQYIRANVMPFIGVPV